MSISTKFLKNLNITETTKAVCTGTKWLGSETNGEYESFSPVDGKLIGKSFKATNDDYKKLIATAEDGFKYWKTLPAPQRGEIVRQIGNKLREFKQDLGELVSYEMGKSLQEGLGEVQEMIDICDFAVGLI